MPPPKSEKNHNNLLHRSYQCPPPSCGLSPPLRRMGLLPQYRRGTKFPSTEGCREAAGWFNPHRSYCGKHTPVTRTRQCPPPPGPTKMQFSWVDSGAGVSCFARRGVGTYRPKPWQRVTQVTSNFHARCQSLLDKRKMCAIYVIDPPSWAISTNGA